MLYTREMKLAIAKAYHLSLDFTTPSNLESWEKDKRAVTVRLTHKDSKGNESVHKFGPFPGKVIAGYKDEVYRVSPKPGATGFEYFTPYDKYVEERHNLHEPETGTWSLLYVSGMDPIQSAFRCIPVGSTLLFQVYLDALTNQYLVDARMHGDRLEVIASGKPKTKPLQFILDTSTGKHNTARFGYPMKY